MKMIKLFLFILLMGSNLMSQEKPIKYSNESYTEDWNKVHEYQNKSLPKSALKELQMIYQKAKQDKNPSTIIKSLIYRFKYNSQLAEFNYADAIKELETELKDTTHITKNILHSILAEMYWNYYQTNRYYYLNRTNVANMDISDIKTWDIRKIVEVCLFHYEKSLENESELQSIQIDLIKDVLNKGHRSEEFRPTLYDFLAHRALDFFKNSESSLTKPADYFTLDDKSFFLKADLFIDLKVKTEDSFSFKYKAFLIFQKLISFHKKKLDFISKNLKKEDKLNPYIDLELKRLKFVHTHSNILEKDKFYYHALKNLEEKYIQYKASTQVTYHIAQTYAERARLYIPQNSNQYKTGYIRAIQKCKEAIQRFPNSDGALNCKSLESTIKNKELSILIERHNIPNKPFRMSVDYRNFSELFLKVYPWTQKDEIAFKKLYADHQKTGVYLELGQALVKYIKDIKPVENIRYDLPKDDDFHKHTVEIKAPSLDYGKFLIIASDNDSLNYSTGAIAYGITNITNISYMFRDIEGKKSFHILDRTTGQPLSNIKSTIVYEAYNNRTNKYEELERTELTTNQDGNFQVSLYGSSNYRYYYVMLEKGEDKYTIDNETYDLYYYDTSKALFGQYSGRYEKPEAQSNNFVHFFTDRAIYRPGQLIYFKGVLLNKTGDKVELLKNSSVSVYFYDVNHQLVSQLNLQSNDFGTVNGSFTAPTTGLTGNMQLNSSIGGSVSFSVEEYKRPKFEVKIDPIKGAYKLGDKVKITGIAKAYSGANIDGAKVKFRVVRNAVFPYWWWCFYGSYPSSAQVEIANGDSKTDENGKFDIHFSVIPDSSVPVESSPIFNYTVYADVTDINGETRSSSKMVSASYQALVIHANLSDKIDKNKQLKFDLKTQNLSGEFEQANVQITISKLKSPNKLYRERYWKRPDKFMYSQKEWEEIFPEDVYDDEINMYKWNIEKTVHKSNIKTTDNTKIEINSIQNWKTGVYKVELNSKDKFKNDVKEIKYFILFATNEPKIPIAMQNWFYTNKQTAEPNEHAEILVGSPGYALYEIENRGKIIHREWIRAGQEMDKQKLLSIFIKEEYRGNIGVHYTFVKNNRFYSNSQTIFVPYTNKELDIEFETFRNKLTPGEKEEWRLRIKGKQGEKVSAEMVAALYDSSLDAFRQNQFNFHIYNSYYASLGWQSMHSFQIRGFQLYSQNWNPYLYGASINYDSLNWFGYSYYSYYDYRRDGYYSGVSDEESSSSQMMMKKEMRKMERSAAKPKLDSVGTTESSKLSSDDAPTVSGKVSATTTESKLNQPDIGKSVDFKDVQVRTNFNETAFFYPNLMTNEDGEVIVSFTIPESLTKWKMLGFAHTEDLKFGLISNELTTSKDLMVVPNEPRFFREGDKITFSTKITNVSDRDLKGNIKIEFLDAVSGKVVNVFDGEQNSIQTFSAKKGQSTVINWNLKVLDGLGALTYRVMAKSESSETARSHSDGEEKTLPVLTDRMLVTETMPMNVKGNNAKTFVLDKLLNNTSTTLKHHKLTLEYTPSPVWYAVQALPYIMEYPYECAEQTFNRFYSNSISSHIIDSVPNIKKTFDKWKNPDEANKNALLSNLEKNQELKSALLEETPWVLDAKDENERKNRIAVLFDINRMSKETSSALKKLTDLQNGNGAYSWFKGMPEDRYITQYIVIGFARLRKIGVKSVIQDSSLLSMNQRAIQYLDAQVTEDYNRLKYLAKEKKINLEDNHLSYTHINYLYARSYFTDLVVSNLHKEAFQYFLNQSKKYWTDYNNYMKGMIAISLHRFQERSIPNDIIKSLKETSTTHDELGMYWKETYGYYWYELPIEKQALMIEIFDEVAKDETSVNELKVWLLKQKQTTNWKTTKATSDAIYALLIGGSNNWISKSAEFEIQIGKEKIITTDSNLKKEAGTGYFKIAYNDSQIKPEMGRVVVRQTH